MHRLLLAAVSALLVACVAPLQTPSGCPEVLVRGVPKYRVTDELVATFIGQGYTVAEQTGYSLLLTQNADDFTTQFLFGSQFNMTPQRQLRLNIVEIGTGVKVVANFGIVTNPKSGFEHGTDVSKSSRAAHQLQAVLEDVKTRVEQQAQALAAAAAAKAETPPATPKVKAKPKPKPKAQPATTSQQ